MYSREEGEYYRAKIKAARRIVRGWVKPADLPSNAEIRDEIQAHARMLEGERRREGLREMRLEALLLMRLLRIFRPRLIGSVLTGHIRQGSDIDVHVFSDSVEAVAATLAGEGHVFDVERKRVQKQGEERVFTHIHVQGRYPIELTVYASSLASYVFKSSVTGKAIERASVAQLEALLEREYGDIDLESEVAAVEDRVDRFRVYESLLLPLERVRQGRKHHPEGDALYHSLQVFDLARDQLPYDEEFLLAALLHDVGKGIDPHDHTGAALEALEGFITERTGWLIKHHMEAHAIADQTIGARAHRRLKENESYDELVLLGKCDRGGRVAGAAAPDLDEALEYLRELAQMCGG